MVSKYLAVNKGKGWRDKSFMAPLWMTITTLEKIDDYLMDQDGREWYPDYQYGAPNSYSSFLHNHVNDMSAWSAVLLTHDSSFDAIDYQVDHFKSDGLPLIVTTTYGGNTYGHAVVMTGVEVNNTSQEVENVFYHDPFYGKNQIEASESSWRMRILMSHGYGIGSFSLCCMTMKIKT